MATKHFQSFFAYSAVVLVLTLTKKNLAKDPHTNTAGLSAQLGQPGQVHIRVCFFLGIR